MTAPYYRAIPRLIYGREVKMADAGYFDYAMERLEPIGNISGRAMFGGYGIFHEGDMFALISGSTLYFKVNELNHAAYENAGSKQFKPMPYYEVPAEIMEDISLFHEWAHTSIAIGHSTAKKKRK